MDTVVAAEVYRVQRLNRWLVVRLVLVALALSGTTAAAQEVRESANGEQEAETETGEVIRISCRDDKDRPASWLDRTHSYLSERLCEPAAWFDGFFGDPRAAEETPIGSFFRVRNSFRWDESENFGHDIRVSANISLPRVSDRVRLLISRDESLEGELGQGDNRDDDRDEQTRLGLRLLLSDFGRTQLDLDGTVKVGRGGLNPRVRGRARHTWGLTETTQARFTQTAFWEREDGVGTSSRADWEWLPSSRSLVRLTGRGTVSEGSDGVDWRGALVGFRQLNRRTAIRSEIGAFGHTRPTRYTEEYFVNFRFRRTFLRDWLFYELQPEYAWPRDEATGERGSDFRFIVTLEIQFENAAAVDDEIDHYRGR
jgi:hypothetical protein